MGTNGSLIVGFVSVGVVMLIAAITGFWALLKAIGQKFDEVKANIDTNLSAINNAITELRVSQATTSARQDSLENFVKSLPQLLAQLVTATSITRTHNTDG